MTVDRADHRLEAEAEATATAAAIGLGFERAMAEALVAALPAALERLGDELGPRAYSVRQVAERLGVSDRTVYRLIQGGRLATVPHLSPPRVAATALDDFLRAAS